MSINYTDNDRKKFKSFSEKQKIDCLETYLIGHQGQNYNMTQVGEMVFGESSSYDTSTIHRAYNFDGDNKGLYKKGCRFEKTYGYEVTRRDIEAFVKKYKNGTLDLNITLEEFLLTRIGNVKKQVQKPIQKPNNTQVQQAKITQVQNTQNNYQYNQSNYENNQNSSNGFGINSFGDLVATILGFIVTAIICWFLLKWIFKLLKIGALFVLNGAIVILPYVIILFIVYKIIRSLFK